MWRGNTSRASRHKRARHKHRPNQNRQHQERSPMNDAHLAELQRESWAMEPRALHAFFLAAVEFARHGGINTAQEESPSLLRIDNGAGVISIRGALLKSVPEWARGRATAYRDISSAVNEAAN